MCYGATNDGTSGARHFHGWRAACLHQLTSGGGGGGGGGVGVGASLAELQRLVRRWQLAVLHQAVVGLLELGLVQLEFLGHGFARLVLFENHGGQYAE